MNNYYPFGLNFATNEQSSTRQPGRPILMSDDPFDGTIGGAIDIPLDPGEDIILVIPREDQPWRFGGKELLSASSLDLYDFEARLYDPALGRFLQPDPMAEKYYDVSPYCYCADNPVAYVDPDGKLPNFIVGAVIGAAASYIGQVAGNLLAGDSIKDAMYSNVDWFDVGVSALEGCATGGISSIAKVGTKTVAKVAISATSNAIQTAVSKKPGEDFEIGSSQEIVVAAVVGSVSGSMPDVKIKSTVINDKLIVGKTTSNNKALKNAIEKAASKGTILSVEEKTQIRMVNNTLDKRANQMRESVATGLGNMAKGTFESLAKQVYDRKTKK